MMDLTNRAWGLMCSGRYQEALEIYDRLRPEFKPENWRYISGRGTVLMCLRRYGEAEAEFKLANAFRRQEDGPTASPYLNDIGAAQWLTDRKDEAAETWLSEVDGLINRTIQFADISGGVGPAMLLWFAGKSLPRPELIERSLKLSLRLSKTSRAKSWPGPLALYALGTESLANIVIKEFEYTELNQLLAAVEGDRRSQRHLCQALFYWSFSEREMGNKDQAFQLLKACVDMEMPLETEWFLARGMLDKMQ